MDKITPKKKIDALKYQIAPDYRFVDVITKFWKLEINSKNHRLV